METSQAPGSLWFLSPAGKELVRPLKYFGQGQFSIITEIARNLFAFYLFIKIYFGSRYFLAVFIAVPECKTMFLF